MTMTTEERVKRLTPAALRKSARNLLADDADPVKVVMALLRTIRIQDDRMESVWEGARRSVEFDRELHEGVIDQEHLDIAKAIAAEARRPDPRGRQQLTYAGGLRKAARIARGWR